MIRAARPDEADALAAIQQRASVAALAHIFPPEQYPYPVEEIRRRWREALAEGRSVLVYEDEGELVGVALTGPEWLDGLYVVPERWGSGAPRSSFTTRRSTSCGPRASSAAHLWVLDDNRRARRFYERLGWRLNERDWVVRYAEPARRELHDRPRN